MLDAEWLNDLWKQVNVEDPDRILASDVKEVLEELAHLRRVHDAPNLDHIQINLTTVEKALNQAADVFKALDDSNRAVYGNPKLAGSPLSQAMAGAQVALGRLFIQVAQLPRESDL